ncbi:hypothetical protein FOA52_013275 [Chlamydomonas sp. UWO 241]|nr:hypothetical protein FOA52_013275 [Chlamydomonas sp. UWO 241]
MQEEGAAGGAAASVGTPSGSAAGGGPSLGMAPLEIEAAPQSTAAAPAASTATPAASNSAAGVASPSQQGGGADGAAGGDGGAAEGGGGGGGGDDEEKDDGLPPELDENGDLAYDEAWESTVQAMRRVVIHTDPVVERKGFFASLFSKKPEFADNEIKTAKYNVITFVPVNLFEQFARVANLYFLIIAVLQLIPGLTTTSWFTTVVPLAFVLIFNALKEINDDVRRHRSDREVNNRTVAVLREGGREVPTSWRDVVVGDLVKVTEGQEVPADLLLLSCSDPSGVCYAETANLDGETNLKTKFCYVPTAGMRTADELAPLAKGSYVTCEQPNARLYVFDGAFVDADGRQEPLTSDNLMLRGSTLSKSDWVLGAAVFTGAETKIMQNRTPSPRKITQLERHMNVLVAGLFAALFLVSCALAGGYQGWVATHPGEWYLQNQDEWPYLGVGFAGWVVQVVRFMVMLSGFIPISLYVTLELVKLFQCALVFNTDLFMYHRESDTPFHCHTTNLNEDLGQVEYVLSDKTGTLTQNIMGFVWASVNRTMYGRGGGVGVGIATPALPPNVPSGTPHRLVTDAALHAQLGAQFQALVDGEESDAASDVGQPPSRDVADFLLHLAVCNTVVPGTAEDGSIVYQATSPDEEALVQGAAYLGYTLVSRTADRVEVRYEGATHMFEVLAVLDFNSDRKRMSVVCRCPDGAIRLFCKGADAVVMGRVKEGGCNDDTRSHLQEMAVRGYRTLCIAQRTLSEREYATFESQFRTASSAVKNREAMVARVSERVEADLDLLGATAVEDKLQDGVPQAVQALQDAGIKVWVLTGDKVETAINVALSAALFNSSMSIVELRERDLEGITDDLAAEAAVLKRKIEEVEMENQGMMLPTGATNVGLVIEGHALATFLHKAHQDALVHLCASCKAVVFARVSPMQKANVTKLVRGKLGAVALAIGDGANDVGMITAAHIGVGISGREGRAAVLASDYSFAQFRYVARLLLVHGRSSYKRNIEVVQYSFYKNWAYNCTLIIYAFFSAYSAQPLYSTGLIATLNLFWSSYVIVGYSVLEQDLSPATVLAHPRLYTETMRATRSSFMWRQAIYFLQGTWHACVVFFVVMFTMWTPASDGINSTLWEVGSTMYMSIVITINLKLAMNTRYWTWINHLLSWLSVTTLFLFYYCYGVVWTIFHFEGVANMANVAPVLFSSPQFWLAGVLAAPALALLPDFVINSFQRLLRPNPYQIFQEIEQRQDVKAAAMRELGLARAAARVAEGQTRAVPADETASAA